MLFSVTKTTLNLKTCGVALLADCGTSLGQGLWLPAVFPVRSAEFDAGVSHRCDLLSVVVHIRSSVLLFYVMDMAACRAALYAFGAEQRKLGS